MPVYFITYTVLFWIPTLFFVLFLLKFFTSNLKKSFWIASLIMVPLTIVMEYFYLKFDVWSFSQAIDPLIGIWFWNAPIEEFVFWFGAQPFCLAMYLSYKRLFERGKDA